MITFIITLIDEYTEGANDYSNNTNGYFSCREFCFTLEGDIYVRYNKYNSSE